MAIVPSQFAGGVRPQVAPLAQPGPSGAAILADGVARAGATIEQGYEAHQDAQERMAQLRFEQDKMQQGAAASVAFAQLRTGMAQQVDTLRTNAAPGAAGHVDAVRQAYDPAVDTLMSGITNPDVRQHMMEQVAQYGAELSTGEYHWQAQQANAKMVADVQDASNLSGNLARAMPDPKAIGTEIARGVAELDAMPIGADLKQKLTHARVSTVLGSAIEGATSRGDTALATSLLSSDAATRYLKPAEVESLTRTIGVQERRQAAQVKEQQALVDKATRERIDTHIVQIGQGVQVPDAVLAADQADRTRLGDTSGAQEIAGLRSKAAINGETQPWSPAQYQSQIDTLAAKGTARTPAEDIQLQQLRSIAPGRIAAIRDHPYQWAAGNGMASQPLDPAHPASIAARQQLQGTIQRQTGMRPGLLTDEEAAPLRQQWQQGEQGRIGVINTLAGLGSSAGLDALHQIAPGDAEARRLVVLPQGYRAMAIDGAKALKANPTLVDGQPTGVPKGTPPRSQAAFDHYVGGAMMLLDPADRAAALNTARNIQASYQAHSGAGYNDAQMYTSVHQAFGGARDQSGAFRGGLSDWHGAPVLIPDGMTGGAFQGMIARMSWGADSAHAPVFRGGEAMTPEQVKASYTPVIQPDGRYRFMGPPPAGSSSPSVLHGRDGRVWTVRIDATGIHP